MGRAADAKKWAEKESNIVASEIARLPGNRAHWSAADWTVHANAMIDHYNNPTLVAYTEQVPTYQSSGTGTGFSPTPGAYDVTLPSSSSIGVTRAVTSYRNEFEEGKNTEAWFNTIEDAKKSSKDATRRAAKRRGFIEEMSRSSLQRRRGLSSPTMLSGGSRSPASATTGTTLLRQEAR